ncbi:MAG: hypothetical protein FIB02_12015 [Desulfuromonas sp.]|nr:hypothetical protein [Desulfuromonas sp.]
MPSCIRLFVSLALILLTGCTAPTIPSGSLLLRQVKEIYSREEFLQLDNGRRYQTFLRLGGKDVDIQDGSFVNTTGYSGPYARNRRDIAFVIPGLEVDIDDIVEMEAYATREKNRITRIRQKHKQPNGCRYVINHFLWNSYRDFYCDGMEQEGWKQFTGSFTWYKPPEGTTTDGADSK